MMRWLLPALLGVSVSAAASQTTKQPAGGSKTVSHVHSSKKGRARHRSAGPSYQLHPDPERYQEIQKALADRGYFKGEVNGVWGPDSVEALQRFQTDQKLPNDGKINALSLIALGLGPKHDSVAGTTVPATAPGSHPGDSHR